MEQISVDGQRVLVQRKAIRNLYLRILPDGQLSVSAPRSVSDQAVADFIRSRRAWIEAHRPTPQAPAAYCSGERFFLWGTAYPLQVIEGNKAGTILSNGKIVMTVPIGSSFQVRQDLLNRWYRQALEAALPHAMARGEAATGLHASRVQIRDMRSRWGSCTPKTGAIRLNLHLAPRPPECLDYVIIHELTHLLVPGHGPAFRQAMDRFCPHWQEYRRLLFHFDARPLPPAPDHKV